MLAPDGAARPVGRMPYPALGGGRRALRRAGPTSSAIVVDLEVRRRGPVALARRQRRVVRAAARRRRRASRPRGAPTTSAAQSSPTWRIASGSGSPSSRRASAKIAGCGLITPTRWLTTIARRNGAQPAASTYRSIVAASGQFDRIASVAAGG